jgi:hypothetical protein
MFGEDTAIKFVGCCIPMFLFALLSIYVYLRDRHKRL